MGENMKKLYVLFIFLFVIFLTSCVEETNGIILPDLTGMTREEISIEMEKYDIKYSFKFAKEVIEDSSMLDMFVSYSNGYNIGDIYPKNKHLYIYTTVLPLTHNYSKNLEIDFEWEGKSFLNDGVGEVILVSIADGDTATFKDPITNQTFRVRFLGVDTPEVWAGEDPWGLAASRYTKAKLNNAKTIVLESEYNYITGKYEVKEETYNRYLGFVWVDGVLLNLEIIEEAYSNSTLTDSKYKDIFLEASIASLKTGRHFFGEIDPEYDYVKGRFKD